LSAAWVRRRPALDPDLAAFEDAREFAQMRHERIERRAVDQRDPQAREAGGPGRLGQTVGAIGVLHALREQRQHVPAEVRQMRQVALPPEQRAAELRLQQADRPGQRGLGDVAFRRGAREV
jgi:hypothetical protein